MALAPEGGRAPLYYDANGNPIYEEGDPNAVPPPEATPPVQTGPEGQAAIVAEAAPAVAPAAAPVSGTSPDDYVYMSEDQGGVPPPSATPYAPQPSGVLDSQTYGSANQPGSAQAQGLGVLSPPSSVRSAAPYPAQEYEYQSSRNQGLYDPPYVAPPPQSDASTTPTTMMPWAVQGGIGYQGGEPLSPATAPATSAFGPGGYDRWAGNYPINARNGGGPGNIVRPTPRFQAEAASREPGGWVPGAVEGGMNYQYRPSIPPSGNWSPTSTMTPSFESQVRSSVPGLNMGGDENNIYLEDIKPGNIASGIGSGISSLVDERNRRLEESQRRAEEGRYEADAGFIFDPTIIGGGAATRALKETAEGLASREAAEQATTRNLPIIDTPIEVPVPPPSRRVINTTSQQITLDDDLVDLVNAGAMTDQAAISSQIGRNRMGGNAFEAVGSGAESLSPVTGVLDRSGRPVRSVPGQSSFVDAQGRPLQRTTPSADPRVVQENWRASGDAVRRAESERWANEFRTKAPEVEAVPPPAPSRVSGRPSLGSENATIIEPPTGWQAARDARGRITPPPTEPVPTRAGTAAPTRTGGVSTAVPEPVPTAPGETITALPVNARSRLRGGGWKATPSATKRSRTLKEKGWGLAGAASAAGAAGAGADWLSENVEIPDVLRGMAPPRSTLKDVLPQSSPSGTVTSTPPATPAGKDRISNRIPKSVEDDLVAAKVPRDTINSVTANKVDGAPGVIVVGNPTGQLGDDGKELIDTTHIIGPDGEVFAIPEDMTYEDYIAKINEMAAGGEGDAVAEPTITPGATGTGAGSTGEPTGRTVDAGSSSDDAPSRSTGTSGDYSPRGGGYSSRGGGGYSSRGGGYSGGGSSGGFGGFGPNFPFDNVARPGSGQDSPIRQQIMAMIAEMMAGMGQSGLGQMGAQRGKKQKGKNAGFLLESKRGSPYWDEPKRQRTR